MNVTSRNLQSPIRSLAPHRMLRFTGRFRIAGLNISSDIIQRWRQRRGEGSLSNIGRFAPYAPIRVGVELPLIHPYCSYVGNNWGRNRNEENESLE